VSRRRRAVVCLGVAWVFLACPFLLGCRPSCWLMQRADGEIRGETPASTGPGSDRVESLLPAVSSLGWRPSEQIQVAKDVEGMTEFVDGAAEILWEKGVRKLAVQSYVGPGTGNSAEAFRYEFVAQELARGFWEENCPGSAGEVQEGRNSPHSCERSDPALSQAFFWTGGVVLEVRLYGDRASREALLRLLASKFDGPPGLVGGKGSLCP